MDKREKNRRTRKKAIIASIPVMTGYLVLGMAFGILLADKGYSFLWAFLMSLTIYAGSMQFVAVNLLSGGASFLSAALMTLLVNARHVVYGISMLEKYKGTGKKKAYLIFALTDETYALLNGEIPKDVNEKEYYFLVSLFDQIYWITGSVIGALIGSALTINTAGIDFAMTALFVVIFTEQWLSTKNHIPALLGIGITLVCLALFGTENFLIPSMVLIVLCLGLLESVGSRQQREEKGHAS